MLNIFIDGQAGTTGLKLEERLKTRNDINLLIIDPARRKDPATRQNLMAKADIVFLCLPEDEAIKAASMAPPDTIVIDASTAHRVAPGWVYGLPELSVAHRTAISTAMRIAVPGCHAAGFIAMVYPLLESGIISRNAKLNCNSLTGYSGGGRTMIEEYENTRIRGDYLHAPRPYALGLKHKHLPEMKGICGLEHAPHFVPAVCDIAQGMFVTVPLWDCNIEDVWQAWSQHYRYSKFIQVMEIDNNGLMNMTECNNTNRIDLFVYGHETQLLLGARLDNLGKGASGAALQCMNIACGLDEGLGLEG